MQATVPERDFAHWIALSDAYAQQISRVWHEGAGRPNNELLRLSLDLQAMNQDFQLLSARARADIEHLVTL